MTAPTFGKRGLTTAPPASPTRRLRSGVVVVGAVGALALSVAAAAEWREQRCRVRDLNDPDPRPASCDSHSGGHSSGGHGWGLFSGGHSGGGSIGHAAFGGFGGHASGHGGGG
jgi:hypothetical protein